jgi:hypothetical protein
MWRRAGLGLMAFLIFLCVTELGLAGLAQWRRSAVGTRWAADRSGADAITILCVGDSHTWGAPLPEEESYPSQLAGRLDRLYPERGFRVINAGYPGVNSAFVANRLETQMLRARPDLVIVWVGTNNRWNALETESWDEEGDGFDWDRALLRLKLYRLARVLWHDQTLERDVRTHRINESDKQVGEIERPVAPRPRRLSDEDVEPGIRHDMERMVGLSRSLGVPILFVTYPLPQMAGPNRAIVTHAARLGVPVLITANDLLRAMRDGHTRADLIVSAAGPHPTALLYRYVVESMVPKVVGALHGGRGIDLGPATGLRGARAWPGEGAEWKRSTSRAKPEYGDLGT